MKLDFYLFHARSHVPPTPSFSGGFLHPTVLEISDDLGVENLLADIPFFSVGLLAFGVFTFLLLMKRVALLSVYLYASALLGFIASVVDLIPILALSRNEIDQMAHFESYKGVFVVRGVAFALSTGLRFLFFWTFVAQCPRGERPSKITRKWDLFNMREQGHSASWGRWGAPGLILKWALLLPTLAIPIMQILWRNLPSLPFTKPLYFTEATIEIVLSALFILKLILNIFLSPNSWKQTVPFYIAPFVALTINLGLGVANVIIFLFSETTLGRFLQAVELYILIVYNLTCAFSESPPALPTITQIKRSSSFQGLQEKLPRPKLRIQPDVPGAVVLVGPNPYQNPRPRNEGRLSYLSIASRRLPSLFSLTPKTTRPRSGGERLWNQNSAEQGDLPAMEPRNTDSFDIAELGPRVVELKNSSTPQLPVLDINVQSLSTQPTVGPSRVRGKMAGSTRTAITPVVTPASKASFSLYSYYDVDETPPMPSAMQSPVYGLNGIVETTPERRSVKGSRTTRKSTSSIDDILRKQKELDKSIAALRLFTPATLTNSNTPGSGSVGYMDPRSDSPSAFSEFSLSIFPEPPEVSESSEPLVLPRSRRPKAPRDEKLGLAAVPPPITIPSVDNDEINGRLPETVGATGRFHKFDSVGTQYDVTSFIGHLTGPISGTLTGLTSAFRSGRLSDVQSSDGDSPATVSTVVKAKRPLIITNTRPRLSSLPTGSTRSTPYTAATASSGVLNSSMFAVDKGSQEILPQQRSATAIAPKVPLPEMPSIFNDVGLRRPRGLATGSRVTIGGPRPPPQDGNS